MEELFYNVRNVVMYLKSAVGLEVKWQMVRMRGISNSGGKFEVLPILSYRG
jgi:hypothetical protein